jgi:glucoamylase
MAVIRNSNPAYGAPGIEPRWTRGAKDGVGTAYAVASSVWYTLSGGIVSEVFYPTIDRPQIRDLQFLITDGETFFHDERRHLDSRIMRPEPYALGYELVNTDRHGRYRLVKEVIADPRRSCMLIRTRLEGRRTLLPQLRLFVLLAPHLEVGGWNNTGNVADVAGRMILTAHRGATWLALGATIPFLRCSCGYVGSTDGWQDLAANFKMDYEFDCAESGNIALTGELDILQTRQFTVGLAFGDSLHRAVTTLFQSLGVPYEVNQKRFNTEWGRACERALPLDGYAEDAGQLYRASHNLLLSHEDKKFPGALIASLGIPWGESKGDEDLGGYHLVWTRDLVHAAGGLMASGDNEAALRALIYLACLQLPDGGFYQNFWINGDPYWRGVQLDEVALPILLAWRLWQAGALADFNPYPMVMRAAGYLISRGPVTPQERWEENSGLSPSTLASNIAALVCASSFARAGGDEISSLFLEQYADFLEAHIEDWTVTTDGVLLPGIHRHYIRINPVEPDDCEPDRDPNRGVILIRNRPPKAQAFFAAREIVDAGFLELVRYGIRKPGDALIEDSLQVIDATLKVETPFGPCWHRYNHDGYGERDDGSPYKGWGRGRAWPLLTGERGHYELAAGRSARSHIGAMERFASSGGLLSEQIWDEADRPEFLLYFGRPTGSAMPLMWAHAEYIKLLRSTCDGAVFDLIPEVADRYRNARPKPPEVWKFNRQLPSVRAPVTVRVQAEQPFMLHWTLDDWRHPTDTESVSTALGIDFVDVPVPVGQTAPLRFTFMWTPEQRWEGRDFEIKIAG